MDTDDEDVEGNDLVANIEDEVMDLDDEQPDVTLTLLNPVSFPEMDSSVEVEEKTYQAELSAEDEDRRISYIRNMTTQYLQGQIPFSEIAALLDSLEDDADASSSKYSEYEAHEVTPDDSKKPCKDEENVEREIAKLKGEFYRSGSDLSVFTMRKRRKMSPTIQRMMGEAHLKFARGDVNAAMDICYEIIKEQPTYVDPFHTLAMIFESQKNKKKSLQFALIAALLDPKRCQDWPRLAELSLEEGNIQQAIMCYSKAAQVSPLSVDCHLKKADLCVQIGDRKGALKSYQKILQVGSEDGNLCVDILNKIAHIYHDQEELDKALDALLTASKEYPTYITPLELNLILELCIVLKNHTEALNIIIKFCGVTFVPPIPKKFLYSRKKTMAELSDDSRTCVFPPNLHRDLKQKSVIVLINLEAFQIAHRIVEEMLSNIDVEEFGEEYFEIAEAYMAKKKNTLALKILESLVHSEKFSQAAIWLRYAECLFLLDKKLEAASAYQKVINLAPNHKVAKLNLSIIFQSLERLQEALEILEQKDYEEWIDHDLLLEKCNILLRLKRLPELYQTALTLFSRHSLTVRTKEEAQSIIIGSASMLQHSLLMSIRQKMGQKAQDHSINFVDKPYNAAPEWKLYLTLCKVLMNAKRYDLLCRVTYTAYTSRLFMCTEKMQKDLMLHTLYSTLLNCNVQLAPVHFRGIFYKYPLNQTLLNLLSLALRQCDHSRFKIVHRLLARFPEDLRLRKMTAHCNFTSGSYKYALLEYYHILKKLPKDPAIALMIAITFLHLVCQKTATNRGQISLQVIAFMKLYFKLRGPCQESYYNLGRSLHFLGLFECALRFYKKVIVMSPPIKSDHPHADLDLKSEAAFNIAQIYKMNNRPELARKYVQNFIVV